MSRAIQIDKQGGPEVMHLVDVKVGDPGPGSPTFTSTIFSSSGPPGFWIWMARVMSKVLLEDAAPSYG